MLNNLNDLIQDIKNQGILKSKNIQNALNKIDRINFVPEKQKNFAYMDIPLEIAENQTISQPSTVVFMLELLRINIGNRILDIGAGSGWVSALMAYLTGYMGDIYAYEINKKVGEIGSKNIKNQKINTVHYFIENASKAWDKNSPYDRIYSGASFESIPESLLQNLKNGGVIIAPLRDGNIVKITKNSQKNFNTESFSGFSFVPFINLEK